MSYQKRLLSFLIMENEGKFFGCVSMSDGRMTKIKRSHFVANIKANVRSTQKGLY